MFENTLREIDEAMRLLNDVQSQGDGRSALHLAQVHALIAIAHALREIAERLDAIYQVIPGDVWPRRRGYYEP